MRTAKAFAAGFLGWMLMLAMSAADIMVMPAGQAHHGDPGGHWRNPPPPPAHEAPPVIWEDASPGCPPAPTRVVRSVDDFYEPLSRHGRWLNLHPYRWVWQPELTRVDQDWRPYHHGGRWIVTAGTWTWQSDYPWGWAAFHYGRWIYSTHHGWTWLPDVTWGPAWVQWRGTDTHVGWAPLPPECRYEIGVGYTYAGSVVGFGFHLEFSDADYIYTPCRRPTVIHTTEVFPRRETRVIYRQPAPPPSPVVVYAPPPPPAPRGRIVSQAGRRTSALQTIGARASAQPAPSRPIGRAPQIAVPRAAPVRQAPSSARTATSAPKTAPAPAARGSSRGERLTDLLRNRR